MTTSRWILAIVIIIVIVGAIALAMRGSTVTSGTASSTPDLGSATYSLFGDTFSLANGSTTIQGHSGLTGATDTLVPVGYTIAATSTASGDINGDGSPDEVAALYRGFGANLEWVTLFGFSDTNGSLTQIASGVAYEGDSNVQSVSIENGVVTLNLLVVSAADQQNLAHYEQVPNQPLTLQFTVQDGNFVQVGTATPTMASSTDDMATTTGGMTSTTTTTTTVTTSML